MIIFIAICIVARIIYKLYSKHNFNKKFFLSTHKIKCKVCGSIKTAYLNISDRVYNKFYCYECDQAHIINYGDWLSNSGLFCNSTAKKLGLYR